MRVSTTATLPAHHIKHLQSLNYHFFGLPFLLLQRQDGTSTGTALWLAAQCLSAYLATIHKSISPRHTRPRVLELGSGIGLTALAMNSFHWDVLATDTAHTICSVLAPNIASNHPTSSRNDAIIQVRELDWLVPPESWDWGNPVAVASSKPCLSANLTRVCNPVLQPPFDLIVSSDTIYAVELVQPLLRAIHTAVIASGSPPVYLGIERRDSAVIDRALSEAEDVWGFTVTRVGHRSVSKAMKKGGLKWKKEDWDGVEIWRLKLKNV
ncbi:hypothetical protein F5148DRAFT_1175497 [Russula earlei]|uniref:Uncharacterized protein n=1 Tax=Russula earlei TaxID=71964 RepID=A0ACC0UHW9_9AGAM|nr:hypothetical protein F5148DRAFT_1175497 [Russula earlei]